MCQLLHCCCSLLWCVLQGLLIGLQLAGGGPVPDGIDQDAMDYWMKVGASCEGRLVCKNAKTQLGHCNLAPTPPPQHKHTHTTTTTPGASLLTHLSLPFALLLCVCPCVSSCGNKPIAMQCPCSVYA